MEPKPLIFRKAAASDLDAITAIYDKIHAQEDAGRVTIGWVTGVYPTRFDAEQAAARNELYVCETEGRVAASGILNQRQVNVYADGHWAYPAEDSTVFVLHTLTVDPELSGQGIGRAFVQFYEDTARERGCAVLRMDTNAKTPLRGVYMHISAIGKRISCRARSTASRMSGSCCSKRNYKILIWRAAEMARPAWTAQCTDRKLVGELLPVRRRESHKGDYGRVLLLCGSEGLTGAARLAAKAALRAGSGLVYLGVPEKIYPIIAAGAGSEIVFPLPCDEAGRLCMASLPAITERLSEMDAVLLGPGLGRSEELKRLVQALLSICRVPLVLDADGINAVAAHIDVLRGCACPVVLTPHDGEFLRLGGDPKAADRTQEAMRLANRTHAVLLLKGSRTVITDGLNIYVNHTGNPGLATGGSGDVLAGMIVSLLGQHIMPLEAAAAAAWLHGAAADLAAEKLGEYGMVPEDLLLRIPRLLP